MGESFIGGLILSCVQSFIYDISAGACKGPIKQFKQKKFCKKVEKEIRSFCIRNESLYIDGDCFRNFIDYHKPFDRVMQHALSLGEAMSIEDLSTHLFAEAEGVAKASGQILSVDDRRVLKDLFFLISNEITKYF